MIYLHEHCARADFHERALQLWMAQNFEVEDGRQSAWSDYGHNYTTYRNGYCNTNCTWDQDKPVAELVDNCKQTLLFLSEKHESERICLRLPPKIVVWQNEYGHIEHSIRMRLHFVTPDMVKHVPRPEAD